MGRTLKRVPMDFDWPLKQIWVGYINPYADKSIKCTACDGTGYSPQAKRFHDEWYGYVDFDPKAYGATPLTVDHPGVQAFAERNVRSSPHYYGAGHDAVQREARRLFGLWRNQWCHHLIQADVDALVARGRLTDFTHVPRTDEQREIVKAKIAAGGNSWLPEPSGYVPTADEVNAWSLQSLGHDSINAWVCLRARCERDGVSNTCARCGGHGHTWPSKEVEKAYDGWKDYEPPTGDGYQLWETTTEGSPASPVFASLDALCAWCERNATTFGSNRATAAKWREMLDSDFVAHVEGNAIFV